MVLGFEFWSFDPPASAVPKALRAGIVSNFVLRISGFYRFLSRFLTIKVLMGRYLGIDYGQKRIGLAISDETGTLSFPLSVLENSGASGVVAAIKRIVKEKTVCGIVVGMPLSLDGSRGIAADNVERFADIVKQNINVPLKLWDERLSTPMAERAMIEGGLSRKRRKRSIDQNTAQIILQSYLDAHVPLPRR